MTYDMSNPDPAKSSTWVGGRQLTWQEKCERLETENRRLVGFAHIVHDMSRNEFGRHEGDADGNDPTGTSQGNPHHAVGDVFGYSIGGKRRAYARPERSQEGNPEAWIIDATDIETPSSESTAPVDVEVVMHYEHREHLLPFGDAHVDSNGYVGATITVKGKHEGASWKVLPGHLVFRNDYRDV